MKILKKLFSTDTVIEKATDGIYNGLDKMWHTSEEKEGDKQQRIEMFGKLLELSKNASPARRNIAMIVMALWFVAGVNILIVININLFAELNYTLKPLTDFAIDYVAKPTGLVLAFYFFKNIISK